MRTLGEDGCRMMGLRMGGAYGVRGSGCSKGFPNKGGMTVRRRR